MVGSSDDGAAGDSSCSPAPTPKVVDVEAGTKGMPMIFTSRLSTTRARGTCTMFRAVGAAAAAAAAGQRHQRRRFDIAGVNAPVTWMPRRCFNAAAVVFASYDTKKTYQFYTKPVLKYRSWYYREISGMLATYTAGIYHW